MTAIGNRLRRLPERHGKTTLMLLALIVLLGFGLRAYRVVEPLATPGDDAHAYYALSKALYEEGSFGGPSFGDASDWSPGAPLLYAASFYATGGAREGTARIVELLLGLAAIVVVFLLGKRISCRPAGLLAAFAVAVYPPFIHSTGALFSEPAAIFTLPAAVLAFLWASGPRQEGSARGSCRGAGGPAGEVYVLDPPAPRHPRVRWLLPGVLLGGLALVRPEYLGVAVLMALVVFVRDLQRDWRASTAQALILLAGVAIVVAPWTLRNAIALDRFVPISTGGGQVLFAGTYLPSDGDPEKVGAEVVKRHPELFGPDAVQRLRLEQILARLAAHRYPQLETDRALARMGREQFWDDVSEEPLAYAGFVATKVGRIWSHGPRDVMRQPLWEALHWLLVGLGLTGLVVLAAQRRWEALLLATIFVAITATCALLVASPRRVLVTMPLVAALAGIGVVWLMQRLAGWRPTERSGATL